MALETTTYKTSDTAIAAYLISSGFLAYEIDRSDTKAVFIFSNSNKELETKVLAYSSGVAIGNIPAFFRTYRFLLTKIKK